MVLRSVYRPLTAAVLCLTAAAAGAQTKPLTVEEIYGYEGWKRFNGSQAAMMTWVPGGDPWLSDTDHLWPFDSALDSSARLAQDRPAGSATTGPWRRVDALSGASRPLYAYAELERALVEAGVASAEARIASRFRPSIFNAPRDAFLIAIGDDLYAYRISTHTATRVTDSAGAKLEATFSPDGRSVAFIKNNNIFVASTDDTGERALTTDGSVQVLNGT